MSNIEYITGREVIDSRGVPTVEAYVRCKDGAEGSAMVPSGASTGSHEAHELRDRNEDRYGGKGVLEAVRHVKNDIHAALVGKDTGDQARIDRTLIELDGTENRSNMGANAMLAVSLACARAQARSQGLPLYMYLQELVPNNKASMPVPQMNIVNGGQHASNNISIQEYHVLPVSTSYFHEALRVGVEVYMSLKRILGKEGYALEVGDEGGFAPRFDSSESAFVFLVRAIEEAGYVPGKDVFLGIDAAATEFFDTENNLYIVDGSRLSSSDLSHMYASWIERYPLISIEDPFHEDAWGDWDAITREYGEKVQFVGDDLYVTNVSRIREGIVRGTANAVLVKPNQVGTLTETLQAILLAQDAGHNAVVSHRSGETEDAFIADLAVAVGSGQIKTGAPARSDRTSKYNRLLAIEDESKLAIQSSLDSFCDRWTSIHKGAWEGISFS